jgi:hypothetical protein
MRWIWTRRFRGLFNGRAAMRRKRRKEACMQTIGKRTWAIAEGYIPGWSNGPEPEMKSHETVCVLNTSPDEARVKLTVFFADREPAGPYEFTVGSRRTVHLRLDELEEPEAIPKETPYAAVLESDVPVVVQHSRLDSRQSENALLSTMAFPGQE